MYQWLRDGPVALRKAGGDTSATARLLDQDRAQFMNDPTGVTDGSSLRPTGRAETPQGQPHFRPAERSGLHLLHHEITRRRTALLHEASRPDANLAHLLRDVTKSRYATPTADYIDWLNQRRRAAAAPASPSPFRGRTVTLLGRQHGTKSIPPPVLETILYHSVLAARSHIQHVAQRDH